MRNIDPSYFEKRVGEQLLQHYAQRDAVRHATPLFSFKKFRPNAGGQDHSASHKTAHSAA